MRCEGIDVLTGKAVELQIAQGRITGIKNIDAADPLPYLTTGFFDIQVNGYRGHGYSHENLSEETINKIIAALDASGTTHHLPTLVTLPDELLLENLQAIARAVKSSEDIGSAIAGIHIEGPYISAEDGPRGAHDASYIRNPDAAWPRPSRCAPRIRPICWVCRSPAVKLRSMLRPIWFYLITGKDRNGWRSSKRGTTANLFSRPKIAKNYLA